MSTAVAALSLALVLGFGIALVVVARRLRAAVAEADRAGGQLLEERRSSDEDRRVQDLILASMREGVLLFDAAGRRVFANEAASELLGGAPSGLGALLPLEVRQAARRAAFTGAITNAEVETGSRARWIRATATAAGHDGAVLIVVSDVTEARRLDAVRRDFVVNASHELKTPAASIQAAAETIVSAAEEDPGSVPRFAWQLEREARRLSRIVSDLLDLSRLESGSPRGEPVRVHDVVRDETARARPGALEAGLELHLHAEETPPIAGSARDLALLVRNLLDNAIRYTSRGGRVDVRIGREGGDVVLRVSDTGVGIPARDLPRVFERFFRVDRARSRETGGTGLGLAIVKHVAENHGGHVAVESELGRGSAFTVRLPID
jgi:signal transduction histidine kinase